MALVNFLKFNRNSGGIIADKEYWNVYFRKRMHVNHLFILMHPQTCPETECGIVYGGVGYPAVHHEVVEATKRYLSSCEPSRKLTVKAVAEYAFDQIQKVIRKKVDQKMKFYFGFTTTDLHRGFFNINGKRIDIKNEKIRLEALRWMRKEKKDNLLKQVFQIKATVFGFDEGGITGYHMAAQNSVLAYIHEGFESIGSGKYAAGLSLGMCFKTRNMQMRKNGFSKDEGVFELIKSAIYAHDHFKEVGENFNLILLDKTGSAKGRIRRLNVNDTKLAVEIVRASLYDFLAPKMALQLLSKIIDCKVDFKEIETSLFKLCSEPEKLEFLLRGYKYHEILRGFTEVSEENETT